MNVDTEYEYGHRGKILVKRVPHEVVQIFSENFCTWWWGMSIVNIRVSGKAIG